MVPIIAIVEWHDRVNSVLYSFSRFPLFFVQVPSRNVHICADNGWARTLQRSSLLNVVRTSR